MANHKSKLKNQVATIDQSSDIDPLDVRPDYLPEVVKTTGIEAFGKDDYKTPRIILLQGLSPQLENFPGAAKKDNFWHTGMNVSLGHEFIFVPATASKRVILWRPRGDQGGGILAFSKNGKTWDSGANQKFNIKLKGRKEPVLWNTSRDVLSSKLTEFGTSDPDEPRSAPAAAVIYEYLVYLPAYPELSPCVLGISKTALPNGKNFNTSLAMLARAGTPISCLAVKCFTEQKTNDEGTWTIPNFHLMGKVKKPVWETVRKIQETYSDYQVEYEQEDNGKVDDEIAY